MKQKHENCVDCNHYGPVIARRCNYCYWKHRAEVNAKKPVRKTENEAEKRAKSDLTEWFNLKIHMKPNGCENCGKDLYSSMVINPRTIIAHIVPKSSIPEVATHLLNCAYLCDTCHNWYDNGYREKLRIETLVMMQNRYNKFSHLILPEHMQYVPDFLKQY